MERAVKAENRTIALVTGGAGFVGSNLCERLIREGAQITCLDNLQTGRLENLRDFEQEPSFDFVEHDVIADLPRRLAGKGTRFTHMYHLACAASPPQYQADPEHTMLTNVVGTRNLLRLAEASGARLLLTSTSEVYGDPDEHPQNEDYWGRVNCTGPRACYDEGKRAAERFVRFPTRRPRRLRVARIFNTYGPRMRPETEGSSPTSSARRSRARTSHLRRRVADAQLLLRRRSYRRADAPDGERKRARLPVNLGNPTELSVKALAELVLSMLRSESPSPTARFRQMTRNAGTQYRARQVLAPLGAARRPRAGIGTHHRLVCAREGGVR